MPRPPLCLLAAALGVAAASSCNCGTPPGPVGGDLCGTGTVDGAPYAIDDTKTRLIIVVQRNDGAGCGVFHNHVVSAKVAKLEYAVDSATPGNTTFKITVLADSLDADDPDLRDEFLTKHDPPLDGQPLSDGDRASIRGSVADEVLAKDNPQLVFTVSDLSTASGDGTAKLTAELAGATSTVDVTYSVSKNGDDFVIKDATATLDGAPYGIPRNSLGFCVNPSMELHLDLVLKKANATPVCDLGNANPYTAQLFPDTDCTDNTSYTEVRDMTGRRCMGCHGTTQRLGATVPLVSYDDWRTDSIRNQGQGLFTTAEDFVHRDPTESLAMPPQLDGLATPPTAAELDQFDAWVADGAHNEKCSNDPGIRTFPRAAHVDCAPAGTPAYDVADTNPSAQGATAKQFIDFNCASCHLDTTGFYAGVPQFFVPDSVDPVTGGGVIDHALAQASIAHPYYLGDDGTNLSFWEASVLRYLDNSMPPFGGVGDPPATCSADADCAGGACYTAAGVCVDPTFIAFADWVSAGYPEAACP